MTLTLVALRGWLRRFLRSSQIKKFVIYLRPELLLHKGAVIHFRHALISIYQLIVI